VGRTLRARPQRPHPHQVATERFTWLVGGFYPWAHERELELISDFTSWLFWHDDLCDETTLGEDPTRSRAGSSG
jgi:hypothetical protein